MIPRGIHVKLERLLNEVPAVALTGPRQVGKTTLALAVARVRPSLYLDLESESDRALLAEPEIYLSAHSQELVILDEVHRMPQLFQPSGVWSYIDADEFVRAVTALRNSLGDEAAAAPIEKALNGPADLFLESAKNSDGRNFMFELIVGGRFAGAGFRPSFDKGPDVQVEFEGLQVGVQCKRPFSTAGLQPTIRKAIHQLEAGKTDLGLIAVSVSRLLTSGNPTSIPEVVNHEDGHPYLQARIQQIAQQTERFWSGKLDRAGILFYAFSPIQCQEKPRYFFDRCEGMFPLGSNEVTSTLLKCFAQSLKT